MQPARCAGYVARHPSQRPRPRRCHEDSIKKEEEATRHLLSEAHERTEALKRLKESGEREALEALQTVEAAHMRAAEELEHLYERKLAVEAARWEALRKDKEDVQCQLEERIYALHATAQQAEAKLRTGIDDTRRKTDHKLGEMASEAKESESKLVEMLQQEETDNDQELDAAREAAHRTLVHEREEKQTLKGEQAIMRKKFTSFQSEMTKLTNRLDEKDGDVRELQKAAAEHEKAMALLRKDVHEREESIADKERRMTELKAKNKELEKFKFVLDYKLRELAREIEPRDEQIMQMRETIRELDEELQRDYKTSVGMEQELADRQAKIEALQLENKKARQAVVERERTLSFFGRDIQKLVKCDQPAALREGIKEIYRLIVKADSAKGGDDELVVHNEFTNQRAYMERALDALKTRVGRSEDKSRTDSQKKTSENASLILECNSLRREVRESKAALSQAQTELANAGIASHAAPAAMVRKGAARGVGSAGLLRPGTAGSVGGLGGGTPVKQPRALARGGSSYGVGDPRGAPAADLQGSRGQLLRGSSNAVGRERARTAEMLVALEVNNREMDTQRAEIGRLRQQVHELMGAGAGGEPPEMLGPPAEGAAAAGAGPGAGPGGARPYSSQENPVGAPSPQQARASSAMH